MKIYKLALCCAVLCALVACSDKHNHTNGHHHHDNLQITAYSPNFELYAEATPLSVNHPSEILAHFSHLPGFKPLESGKVTATLLVGNDSVSQTLPAPTQTGIYKFKLTPNTEGDAKLVFEIATAQGNSRIEATGLKVYANHHAAAHAAEDAVATSSNGVAFSKEMSWKVDFSTEPVAMQPMGQLIRTMAQVQPSQGDVSTVTAPTAGTVTFADANFADGKTVRQGEPLFKINAASTADDNLQVRFLQAQSNYETAKREYKRVKDLANDKLATESERLSAENAYQQAKAVYDNLRKGFANGSSAVSAPISGKITKTFVTNGEHVQPGQALATIAQNRHLFIKAELQPSYFPALAAINGANLRRPNSGETVPLANLGGSLVSYGNAVDNDNPLIPVVFRVENNGTFLPGTFVEMFITAGSGTPALTVPNESLIEEMGNYFVYVQLTPEFFEKREVKTGRTDGLRTEILSGVSEGERVVARGAVLVKLAHSSGTLDAHSGHVH